MSAKPPDIAHLYLAALVTIHDAGSWHPAHQVAARLGTLHVITAWNPGDERPSREAAAASAERSPASASAGSSAMPVGFPPKPHEASERPYYVTEVNPRRGAWPVFLARSSIREI